jgi:small-conductance mechanosensitive channel
MIEAIKFILFWIGSSIFYCLLYVSWLVYESVQYAQRHHWENHSSLGLPSIWEVIVVVIVALVAGFFSARQFLASEKYAKPRPPDDPRWK